MRLRTGRYGRYTRRTAYTKGAGNAAKDTTPMVQRSPPAFTDSLHSGMFFGRKAKRLAFQPV